MGPTILLDYDYVLLRDRMADLEYFSEMLEILLHFNLSMLVEYYILLNKAGDDICETPLI